jgi:epsilon-lactone hydrolase
MRRAYEGAAVPLPEGAHHSPLTLGGVPAEWVRAPGAREDATIFFLHGGGYVMGSLATHRALCARLSAAAGCRVASVAYRLAPEAPFPAAFDDAAAAWRALLQDVRPASVVAAGDSGGAGLGLAVLLDALRAGLARPAGVVAFSPWVDLAMRGTSIRLKAAEDPIVTEDCLRAMATAYLGPCPPADPRVSPLYDDLRSLPPLLIQVGTAELLLDDALRLAERARAAGVDVDLQVYPELFHVWQAFAGALPEADEALARAGAFVKRRLAR